MANPQAVWGIDVGSCALTAVKLRAGADGTVEILAHEYVEHAQILSQPDADRHALIATALEKFLSHHDLSKDAVVVSVPGQHTLARFTKLPPVAPKRIPDIVRYEADQQIPFNMDEVIWDYQVFEQEDLPDIEVGIFAMRRELVREHLLDFEQAAIEPIAVQPAPLAVYNAVSFDGGLSDETTIILDIGADNTDLIIATPHNLWTRTIPIGGNHCTDALVKSFKLTFAKAESLKRSAETSKYRRQILQAMRPVFADLVQELQRSVGFYSSTHRDAQIEKVFGVGNAFKLPGLQKYLEQNLGMTVQCPDKFKKAAPGSPGWGGALVEQLPSFWAAYGLALQGADLTKVNSNLLPAEIARQAVWRRKRPAFAAAAACLLLAGGMTWFRLSADMSALGANSAGADNISMDGARARRIIDTGPAPGLSLRARAASIKAAGEALKSELGKLRGQGEEERTESEELIRLQQGKSLIPKILQAIHESIPVPAGPLGTATTPEAVLAAIKSGQALPRGERNQVFIQSLNLQYYRDINNPLWPEEPLNKVSEPINDPAGEQPGLRMEIICTTPNQGGLSFITETFVEALHRNGKRPGTGFYIDRVYVIEGSRVGADAGASGFGGSRGFLGRSAPRAGSGSTASKGKSAAYLKPEQLDPTTNEPFEQDWKFEIWLDAILEDYPEPEDEEGEIEEEGD